MNTGSLQSRKSSNGEPEIVFLAMNLYLIIFILMINTSGLKYSSLQLVKDKLTPIVLA